MILAASVAALSFATPALAQDKAADAVAVTDVIWPDGTVETMMSSQMDQMLDLMMSGLMEMPMETVVQSALEYAETDEEALVIQERIASMSLGELLALTDPHFEERQTLMNEVMMEQLTPIMVSLEPQMKARLAQVMERQYSVEELAAARAFFDSEHGRQFGIKFMTVSMDPEYLAIMGDIVPLIVEAMPEILRLGEEATSHLPDPNIGLEERLEAAFGDMGSKD